MMVMIHSDLFRILFLRDHFVRNSLHQLLETTHIFPVGNSICTDKYLVVKEGKKQLKHALVRCDEANTSVVRIR